LLDGIIKKEQIFMLVFKVKKLMDQVVLLIKVPKESLLMVLLLMSLQVKIK